MSNYRERKAYISYIVFASLVLVFILACTLLVQAASTTEIKTGQEYYITSVQYPGRAVNMYVDSTADIKNRTTVNLYATDKSATQRFTFTKNQAGNYLMIPRGSKYTVNVSSLSAGTAVFAWENKAANNEYFIIEKTADGYFTLRMENAGSLYLTADSSTKLTLRAKASGSAQKFEFHEYPEPAANPAGESVSGAGETAAQIAEEAGSNNQTVKAPVTDGQDYYITSAKYPGKAVNMYVNRNSAIKNKTKVTLYTLDKSETQRFRFMKSGDGKGWLIVPTGTKYTVNVNKLAGGATVFAYKNDKKNNEPFIVETDADGYTTFRTANKSNLYLSAKNNSTLTLKATANPGKTEKFVLVNFTVQKTEAVTNEKTQVVTDGKTSVILDVKHILQTKGSWAKYHYDPRDPNPGCTIRKYGCTITSCCMIYNFMNKTTYNPQTYAQKRLKFNGNGEVTAAKGSDWGNKFKLKYSGGKYTCQNIRAFIDKGMPLLIKGAKPLIIKGKVQYHWDKKLKKNVITYVTHFVVAYGYKNNARTTADILIRDPNGSDKTLGAFLKRYYTKSQSNIWRYVK